MKLKYLIFLAMIFSFVNVAFTNENIGDFKQEHPKPKMRFENKVAPNNSFTNSNNSATKSSVLKSDRLADKIVATLYLTDAESKIVHDFCIDRSEKIEKIKLNSDNSQQKIIDLQVVNQEFDNKIKQLVTPAQYQKFENLRRNSN
jgi:hypothetical protein